MQPEIINSIDIGERRQYSRINVNCSFFYFTLPLHMKLIFYILIKLGKGLQFDVMFGQLASYVQQSSAQGTFGSTEWFPSAKTML